MKFNLKKIMWIVVAFSVVLFVAWIGWGYFSTANIEMPDYEVLEKKNGYEIRQYEGFLSATTEVEANDWDEASGIAFRRLGGFIFGDNTVVGEEVSDKIAMTVPVIFEEGQDRKFKMTFTMPSKFTKENLPKPNDELVEIVEVPGYRAAVLSFSGFYPESRIAEKQRELITKVEADGYNVVGQPLFAAYNPPWTPPFMRRNEVWVKVKSGD